MDRHDFTSSRATTILSISAAALAIICAVIIDQGDPLGNPLIPPLILGLAAIAVALHPDRDRPAEPRVSFWLACLLPAYVALQLLPLPLGLLRFLDPARAEIAGAVQHLATVSSFAPLSIAPEKTWAHLLRIVAYVLVFLLVRDASRRRRDPWICAVPLIVIGAIEAAIGLAQQSAGAQVVSGTYQTKDHFSGLLEMVLPLALIYGVKSLGSSPARGVLTPGRVLRAAFFLGVAAITLGAIALSFSKMGFVSALGSLFVMGILGVGSRFAGGKRWAVIAAFAMLALALFVILSPAELVSRFEGIASDTTAEGRLPIARDTLKIFAAYPVFGTGLGTFTPAILRYQTYGFSMAWSNAHNDYLEGLAELGLVGFSILGLLVCPIIVRLGRAVISEPAGEVRLLALACVGSISAILIHSFADFNMYVPANAMVFSWVLGLAAGANQPDFKHTATKNRWVKPCVIALGSFAVIYSSAWLFVRRYPTEQRTDTWLCRVGMCDSDATLARLREQHGGNIALVPLADLTEFLRRDPAAPNHWCDLGEALQRTGQIGPARFCFARALVLAPHIPYMLLRNARFHFSVGENREALELSRHALEGNPEWFELVIPEYEKARVQIGDALKYGIPADPRAWKWFLSRQMSNGVLTNASAVWSELSSHGYADDRTAGEYVGFLIRRKLPENALQAWGEYAHARTPGYPGSERVFNGDFEFEPSGSPLDWNIETRPGAAISFDRDVKHSGARSLRIQFDGSQNLTSPGIRQQVVLTPGKYRFSAYYRASNVSTDEGFAFEISGETGRLRAVTAPILGSHEWTLLEITFEVPAGPALADVRLARKPSLKFDSLIRGTLWIDQVSIRPESSRTP